eukprot:2040945-Rhodomonas_salina.2
MGRACSQEVITALESRHQDKDIVLVSHADTLQILQLYLSGAGLSPLLLPAVLALSVAAAAAAAAALR